METNEDGCSAIIWLVGITLTLVVGQVVVGWSELSDTIAWSLSLWSICFLLMSMSSRQPLTAEDGLKIWQLTWGIVGLAVVAVAAWKGCQFFLGKM